MYQIVMYIIAMFLDINKLQPWSMLDIQYKFKYIKINNYEITWYLFEFYIIVTLKANSLIIP